MAQFITNMKNVNVNPCNLCTLKDAKGNVLGETLDTPNAIAYAMAINPRVHLGVTYYHYFGEVTYTREDLQDRFSWVVKETNLNKYLQWR